MKNITLIAIASLSLLLVSSHAALDKKRTNTTDANGNKVSLIKEFSFKRKHHRKSKRSRKAYHKVPGSDAGLIKSGKTGAQAWVHPKYAQMFQDYIDDLERRAGVAIHYMGGWRRGRCSSGSQHPCGKALDVCQDSRGRTDHLGICHLPSPAEMAAVAKLHGLYEGSRWCDQDYGHAQVDPSGGDCKPKGWTAGVRYVGFLPTMTGKMASTDEVVAKRKVSHRTLHAARHHRRSRTRLVTASAPQQYQQAYYRVQTRGGDVQMRSH